MANTRHLTLLRRGTSAWNRWRQNDPIATPRLGGADLRGWDLRGIDLVGAHLASTDLREVFLRETVLSAADLHSADLRVADARSTNLNNASLVGADLRGASLGFALLQAADLTGANLEHTSLMGADLRGARLKGANLRNANLVGANLREADLHSADLSHADLSQANLSHANLMHVRLVETSLERAMISGSRVYGVCTWAARLEGASQENLVLTRPDAPAITVDNLEVAQLVYLLLHGKKIQAVVDAGASNFVLILGDFPPDRRPVLEGIREELRRRGYAPLSLEMDGAANLGLAATASTLARFCRFVIVDRTGASRILKELQALAPDFPPVPVLPILQSDLPEEDNRLREQAPEWGWGPEVTAYRSMDDLAVSFDEQIVAPAEARARAVLTRRWAIPESILAAA